MGEDDIKPGQTPEGDPPETPDDPVEALAKELGFPSAEALRKKGKGLRKWESEVNSRHQQTIRQPAPAPSPAPAAKSDNPLEGVSPKVIEAVKAIVREEVGPQLNAVQQDKAEEMSGVVEDFLDDNPEISQVELFEVMSKEELWPDEKSVNKRLLKRRLNAAKKLMKEPTDESEIEARIRRQILAEMKENGGKVVDIQPKRKVEGGSKPEKPQTWYDRMQAVLNEG